MSTGCAPSGRRRWTSPSRSTSTNGGRSTRRSTRCRSWPRAAGSPDGVKLKAASPVPIYVDEDCHTLQDVAACVPIAHGINIKLAKSGGIREGVRMAHAARAAGLGVMLGCMVETGLGIAAGAAMASLCDHVDLDGNLLIAHDPWPGVELADGIQTPSEEPGLGVRQAVPDPR